jgi:protoheme IX farnesyltransferase
MLGAYYNLAKPRMVYANLVVAAAAFVYGSPGALNWPAFGYMALGLGLVMAGGCVFNNYQDRAIDARMARTKNRGSLLARVGLRNAALYGCVLAAAGFACLWATNAYALAAAAAGFVLYAGLYTPLKPQSAWALFVGAAAGATPPLVGYAAGAGTLDAAAWLLFAFLFIWQLPHFVAISIYRGEEYAAAGVPMFWQGPFSARQKYWARLVFYLSLVVLLAWCVALMLQR